MASAECSQETKECTRRIFEAVKQNSVFLLESARKTYSEIQLLTSFAECNQGDETPLEIAIKRNYVSVVKEITRFFKMLVERNIVEMENQLKITFIINQLFHHIPIKELIEILIYDSHLYDTHKQWLMFIAKLVIKSISVTRQDKIYLLELIGVALITYIFISESFAKEALCGLECWREAITLRYFPTDGGDPIPKLPDVHVPSGLSSFIFGSAVEVATIEEVDVLQEDFERHLDDYKQLHVYLGVQMPIPCAKPMLIQALLVSRRISAQEQLGHPHWLYLQSLFSCPFVCGFELEDNFRVKTYLFMLEELNGFDQILFPLKSYFVFIKTVDLLTRNFIEHLREPLNGPGGRELNYSNLMMITKLVTTIQCNQANDPHFQNFNGIQRRFLDLVYRLVIILNSISSRITKEEQQKLEKFYCDYIRDFPERTTTVLHVAVLNEFYSVLNQFSMYHAGLQIVKQILKFGADPNAINEYGQTPLHCLAERTQFNKDESVSLFQVLVDAGAHLDAADDNGETVLCILKKNLCWQRNFHPYCWHLNFHPYFESLINSVFPLSCYCARVILRHGIPFEDRLPPRLNSQRQSLNRCQSTSSWLGQLFNLNFLRFE